MAFDSDKLFKKVISVIEKKKCFFIEDVAVFVPCSKVTLYEHFPKCSNEMNAIKEALNVNRVTHKHSMRSKWYKSDNPTLQMGLYKLIGTEEERKALSQSHHDFTTKNKELPAPSLIDYDSLPTEVLEAIINAKHTSPGEENPD